jgi:hypothetical protein
MPAVNHCYALDEPAYGLFLRLGDSIGDIVPIYHPNYRLRTYPTTTTTMH